MAALFISECEHFEKHLSINLKSHKVYRYPCGPYLRGMEREETKFHCTRALLLGELCVHNLQLFCYDRIFRLYVLSFFFPRGLRYLSLSFTKIVLSIVPIEACVTLQSNGSRLYISFILLVAYDAGGFLRFFYNKTEDLCELVMLALMIYPTFQTCWVPPCLRNHLCSWGLDR